MLLINSSSYRMELGGIPFGGTRVPCNPWLIHGIPRNFESLPFPWNAHNFMEFHGNSKLGMEIPWHSMKFGYVTNFHGTFNIPWNSMDFLNWERGSHGYITKFHGTFKSSWNSMKRLFSVSGFRGISRMLILMSCSIERIPRNFHYDSEKFHGIPCNSMEPLASSMKLWNIYIDTFQNLGTYFTVAWFRVIVYQTIH